MDDKYVAFLDVLGFTAWANEHDLYDIQEYFSKYIDIFESVWKSSDVTGLTCHMVSDCAVIHTDGLEKNSLKKLVDISVLLAQALFKDTGILIRGGIAKGNFIIIGQPKNNGRFNQYIFSGKAYIDAYDLEDKAKVAGISVSDVVCKDLEEYFPDLKTIPLGGSNSEQHLVRYLNVDFLESDNGRVLDSFIDKAMKASWLPHYHNALYAALYKETKIDVRKDLFNYIIETLENADKNGAAAEKFIQSAFSSDVDKHYQEQFCTYIRHLREKDNPKPQTSSNSKTKVT